MDKLESIKNEFEDKEFTMLGFQNKIKLLYGLEFFMDSFYNDLKTKNKSQISYYGKEVEFYNVSAEIVKEGKEGYHDTVVKILKIELL